jgi:hypothetical protein
MNRTRQQKSTSIEHRDPLLELARQVSLERATLEQAERSGNVSKATLKTMHRVVGLLERLLAFARRARRQEVRKYGRHGRA